ncbi:hypothetical protein ACFPME_12105 [Rhodanobacter umsongensis]|uniref:Uncharacterized protein n=1 Tax=Rhodanobacter umsongensis TaxID=633153 RepID=A0ABW0JMY0_9GAMM
MIQLEMSVMVPETMEVKVFGNITPDDELTRPDSGVARLRQPTEPSPWIAPQRSLPFAGRSVPVAEWWQRCNREPAYLRSSAQIQGNIARTVRDNA